MKRKKLKFILTFAVLFLIVGICIFSLPSTISFAYKNHLPLSESKTIFLNSHITKKLEACKEMTEADAWAYLSEQLDPSTRLNDSYRLHSQLYVDMTDTISGRPIHMIYKIGSDGITKYIDDNTAIIKNYKNKKIETSKKAFETIDVTEKQRLQYADPFAVGDSGFIEKHKSPGLQEKVFLGATQEEATLTVYETMDQLQNTTVLCTLYPKGTEAAQIALSNQTILSNVMQWFPKDSFDEKQMLKEEALLCKEKQFQFRYGRQVGLKKPQAAQEEIVMEVWENATAKYTLQHPYPVNLSQDCIQYELLQYPEAMRSCDAFYKENALHLLGLLSIENR